jgi:hypothetical protein
MEPAIECVLLAAILLAAGRLRCHVVNKQPGIYNQGNR